jgi:hypothetical protein
LQEKELPVKKLRKGLSALFHCVKHQLVSGEADAEHS